METQATILHADLDAFYASVEQLLNRAAEAAGAAAARPRAARSQAPCRRANPSLRDKPIAVGGGVVLAASYEAKAFSVRGGMSGRKARELCPQLIFVGGHFSDYYQRLGDATVAILGDFTPLVERISIDEAFVDAGLPELRTARSPLLAGASKLTAIKRAREERRLRPADLVTLQKGKSAAIVSLELFIGRCRAAQRFFGQSQIHDFNENCVQDPAWIEWDNSHGAHAVGRSLP